MTDIFFSYRSTDRERVRPIHDALAEQGFEVFWDQEVPSGVDWDSWIRQHLSQSKCSVVFWSATSVKSDNVRHEATVAKHQNKLIMVLLESLTPDQLPMGLYSQQAINLADWSGNLDHPEWRKLANEIEEKLTPVWVRRKISELQSKLLAERARREDGKTLQAPIVSGMGAHFKAVSQDASKKRLAKSADEGMIFINYRRGDDPGFAGRLFDRLTSVFRPEQLFMDVDSIAPGEDFISILNEQVSRCDIFLAIIGRSWLESRDQGGRRRLDDSNDFVRVEIETGLGLGKRVIPVLVNNAAMPGAEELPPGLKPLARRNAVRISHDHFGSDSQGLINVLRSLLAQEIASRSS